LRQAVRAELVDGPGGGLELRCRHPATGSAAGGRGRDAGALHRGLRAHLGPLVRRLDRGRRSVSSTETTDTDTATAATATAATATTATTTGQTPTPPQAERRPFRREHHGRVFVDDYEWLRDKDAPATRAYLEAEN